MTSPETTNPEVLKAAREGAAQLSDVDYPHVAEAVREGHGDSTGLVRTAIAAINEYRRSGSGVVKALEWKDLRGHSFPNMWCATSPCGVYDIEERSASDSPAYIALGPHYAFIADKDSLEEAKVAAQADYERRIRSALAEPAAGEATLGDILRKEEQKLVEYRADIARRYGEYTGNPIAKHADTIADGRLLEVRLLQRKLSEALSTGQGGRAEPAADEHRCPICLKPLVASDECATDIELGICHAACLEGSPTVDLDTGDPIDGPISTYFYGSGADGGLILSDPACGISTSHDGREAGESPSPITGRAALIERLETTETRLNNHIDYSIDLARIIESLCGGSGTVIRPKTTAEHHYKMAVEFAKKHSDQATNLRHWREECGKLHGKLRNAEAAIAALSPSNGGK